MRVICIKNSKNLIKGNHYDITLLKNNLTTNGYVYTKYGRHSVNYFTDTSGNPLPKINASYTDKIESTKFEDLKVGDILVCNTDRLKTFVKNGKYKIEKLNSSEYTIIGYNGRPFKSFRNRIKFVGISREMKWSSWYWKKPSLEETRNIFLEQVLEGKEPDIITQRERKIDFVENKTLEIISSISKSIIDPNRHSLSIIQWAIQKSSSKMNFVEEDFTPYLNMTLSEILEILDK